MSESERPAVGGVASSSSGALIVRAVSAPDRAGSAPDDQHVEPSGGATDTGRIGGDDNAAERRLGAAQPAE
jgi:hypothetical protein